MTLDPHDLYHVAWVVPNLETAMDSFGSVGLRWATPVTRHIVTKTPRSDRQAWSIDVTYSIDDPFHVELIKHCPGSPWQLESNGTPHHMGWWAHDLRRDVERLEKEGYRLDAWMVGDDDEPTRFAYLLSPTGLRVELVDISARPQLQAWWSGSPYP